MQFESQASDSQGARPDLVARGPGNRVVMLLEAKFWAALTDNQPVGYLQSSLLQGQDGRRLLMFLAPAQRLATLSVEVAQRLQAAQFGFAWRSPQGAGQEERVLQLEAADIVLCSWRALLAAMHDGAAAATDVQTIQDLHQLQALTQYMDETAFLPLREEELNPYLGRRIMQLNQLVDDIVTSLVASGRGDRKGLTTGGSKGYYGRYVYFDGWGVLVQFNAKLWHLHGHSPLWVGFKQPDWQRSGRAWATLGARPVGAPVDDDGYCCLPLQVLTGVERDAVVRHAVAAILELVQTLGQYPKP